MSTDAAEDFLLRLNAALGDAAGDFQPQVLAECDSSNAWLARRANYLPDGALLVALRQTAGRGRMGRSWFSAENDSLTFSFFWRPPPATQLSGLSLAVGVALVDALESLGARELVLKWPNDVLWQDKKIAGILVEAPAVGKVIIGIGINLRSPKAASSNFPEEIKEKSIALDNLISPASYPPEKVLAVILANLRLALKNFTQLGLVVENWQKKCTHLDQRVSIIQQDGSLQNGICRGINSNGALLLETAQGIQHILSGDVSLRTS